MTTSAVLTKSVSQITEEALRDARIVPAEQDVQPIDSARCLTAINNIVKFWQTQGINLWLEQEAVLPLIADQKSYTLGPNGDHCTQASGFVSTTLSAAEALGQTVLSVTSSTGMTAADNVGIQLDAGTRQWTTIVSVDSDTQITVTASLTSAAASGNTLYTYTTIIPRPVRVLSCRYADTVSGSEIPVNRWSRQEYFNQPDKTSSGTVVQWYYDPQRTDGELYVWQVASSVNAIVRFTYMSPALVYDASTDVLDFPSEWYLPLKWAIAAEIGPQYGLPDNRQAKLEANAFNTLEQVLGHDVENDSVYFQPDFT
jgi:hypothetical protein